MIITKTPFRVSFVGGGTDLADYYRTGHGAVVSTAINKYIYITINKRFDDSIRLSYSKTEIVEETKDLHHDIAKACMDLVGINGGVEITSIADVPAGTGLGSSSTFTVGLLNALYTYVGDRPSAQQLAEEACEVEIDILKHPIGKQDQYAAAYGGINYFIFNQDGSVMREKISLDDDSRRDIDRKLMMFYTGIRRSADDILEKQKSETKNKLENLNYMRDQAAKMHDMLVADGFNENFAVMLDDAWQRKKKLTGGITTNEIDEYYKKAIAAGAKGGKLLGAGGGGFILLYCDEQYQPAVRKAIGLKEMEFRISRHGSRVVYYE